MANVNVAVVQDSDNIVQNVIVVAEGELMPSLGGMTYVAVTENTGPAYIGGEWDGVHFNPPIVPDDGTDPGFTS